MWKDVDVPHLGHEADAAGGSYVRHDAAGQRESIEPGETHSVAGKRDTGLLHDALRQVRELFIRIAPLDPRQRPAHAMAGRPSFDDTVADTYPRQQRVVFVGNRGGIVCQRHHLALVFELSHVEEAGHLLEEDAQRGSRG